MSNPGGISTVALADTSAGLNGSPGRTIRVTRLSISSSRVAT